MDVFVFREKFGQERFSVIIATDQTVNTVVFVTRVAQLEKLCIPGVKELPSSAMVSRTSTSVTSPV